MTGSAGTNGAGTNGAGKTTLIGGIAGLVRAPAGKLLVFGHDAVSYSGHPTHVLEAFGLSLSARSKASRPA